MPTIVNSVVVQDLGWLNLTLSSVSGHGPLAPQGTLRDDREEYDLHMIMLTHFVLYFEVLLIWNVQGSTMPRIPCS